MKDKNSPDYDKLFKIRRFLDLLLPRFLAVYNLERKSSIDETLIKFKGKSIFASLFPSCLAASESSVLLLLRLVLAMDL